MNDIFAKDLSGELVSPEEPGYELLIDDIFSTMETAQELATVSVRDQKRVHELMEIILGKPVKIGKGSIVGAQSVVAKDVPPMTVVAGNPARIIKKIEL